MANKTKSSKPSRQPLTIAIHGRGVDIDATITDTSGYDALLDSLAERLLGRSGSVPQPTAAEASEQLHYDLDVVQRVIKQVDVDTLQVISDLARQELEARQQAAS